MEIQISLAAARVNAGLTQQQAAKSLRIGKQILINWEKGKTSPTVLQANALCSLYGIPLSNIFLRLNLTKSKKGGTQQ